MKMEDRKYDLEERLLDYATGIIKLTELMPNTVAAKHIAKQLLRSGTSPLANHGEAQAAESSNDFIHKMKLCLKELRESHRWLRLIERTNMTPVSVELGPILIETEDLIKIFVKSIQTAMSSQKRTSKSMF